MSGYEWDAAPAAGSAPAAGTAGNDFLAGFTDGPGSHDAAQKMKNAGNTLKTLAQNGSFAVNEAGFNAYMKACDFFMHGYNRMIRELGVLSLPAGMGNFDYGVAVANFNVQVASVGGDAMLPNLVLMRDAVDAAQQALAIARKNYQETEHAHSVSFAELNKKIDGK
ncbi:hypothetical protein F9C11_02950 [Amycolatopsis sp. VS8301801F10]|uniref:hypothetical protein n=1 Tax=Amycolatopsis sp. VS8301801F10 TaxID=2652442 RepID=UPI0038FBFB0D